MAGSTFLTVPVELVEFAEAAVRFFHHRGYKVIIEHWEVGFPSRPALFCRRRRTRLIVIVQSRAYTSTIDEWARYGASCSSDTQVAVCVPDGAKITAQDLAKLQKSRIGLYSATSESLNEMLAPVDLAMNVALPDASTLPVRVRQQLGAVYEQFDRGQWRDGFKAASQVLEDEARKHLKKGIKSGRVIVTKDDGSIRRLSDQQIDKLSLGQLAHAYARIQIPNLADSVTLQALQKINPDRVGITHHAAKATTEKKLRGNVGTHMWSIVNALKELQR